MGSIKVVIRSARIVGHVQLRVTATLDACGVVVRDLARYYGLLAHQRPGAIVSAAEASLIGDTLPAYAAARREARRGGGEVPPLAAAVEARAGATDARQVDVGALVDRLRGLEPAGLLAVVDLAERADPACSDTSEGRGRDRREFGIDC